MWRREAQKTGLEELGLGFNTLPGTLQGPELVGQVTEKEGIFRQKELRNPGWEWGWRGTKLAGRGREGGPES